MKKADQISIRRPKEFEEFIQGLAKTKTPSAPFNAMSDVLVFAAALGFKRNLRESFSQTTKEKIEYSTMKNNDYFETLMSSMSVMNNIGDHDCLSSDRLDERVLLFEEFMCGGLRFLNDQLRSYGGNNSIVVFFETLVSNSVNET
jgi:dnd system-associated protein 4